MTARNEATERQVQAAHPRMSTWLEANAGSGKTRVLTDRVARLLLDGVEPQHILCLTYTKAAASEMQNRLFKRLGSWAMLENAALTRKLLDLGVEIPGGSDQLDQARTLFARALETPGGLKIQTIHSFCASLLRRFPLEAGVSPQFAEMEDRAAALLRAEIVEGFADGEEAGLVQDLAQFITDVDFEGLTKAITGKRSEFQRVAGIGAIYQSMGLPANLGPDYPLHIAFDGSESGLVGQVAPILAEQSKTMIDLADALAAINWETPQMADLQRLYPLFLYAASGEYRAEAKTKSVPTKKAQEALGPLLEPVFALMERVAKAREAELAMRAARKSKALHDFAAAFLPEYERRKLLRGWLDFDDLIQKARQLLNDPEVAAWVLYRLDGGIDHILVDEAQDTSPAQWNVIEKLAQEFTSGLGARPDVERTIFVVGDKKQSIYSFQGADPRAFDQMQADFGRRLADIGSGLVNLTLEYSFRSSTAILQLVDLVFASQEAAGFRKEALHKAFKGELPGRVDLWPVVEKVDDSDDRDWTDPIDRPSPQHHNVVLARRIAADIQRMIATESIPVDGGAPGSYARRPVEPGDVLILVQRRSDLFAEIIRACKSAGLPIAGADRLKVGAELAVKDLAAVLAFLATPEDNLSLATALKSPLFGWNEQQLFDLAHRRDKPHLWQALRERGEEFPDTMAILNDLRGQTDFLRPYDLIERILTRHEGRKRLLGRLGTEAEDGINALLSQALAYERSDVPSLTGFLQWMETDDLEIKRQMGSGGNMIRVMTVHGAKGLEAPIVILPDTGPRKPTNGDEIMLSDSGVPLWKTPAAQMPAVLRNALADARSAQEAERMRLLYVALTRAEKWLIIMAAGDMSPKGESWYQMVEAAMGQAGAGPLATPLGDGLRLDHGDWGGLPLTGRQVPAGADNPLPGCFATPAPAPEPGPAILNPSDLGGAKALPGGEGLDEEAAKLRGTRLHLLLETLPGLPNEEWPRVADQLLSDTPVDERAELLTEASRVIQSPELAHVFAPDTLAEVVVTAPFGTGKLRGAIDRLVLSGNAVTAVDFKSNAAVPDRPEDCPEGILRQMGAYATALAEIYPDREIRTAILWTRAATLMDLPHDLVSHAVKRTGYLDDAGEAT